jgi:RNA polymerase sigma-70 factor (ECF subfamily)
MPGGGDWSGGLIEGAGAVADETLARRLQGGDRDALEKLVQRYLRPVHAVVASFLAEPTDVEDAAQETFLRALGAIERYDPRRPFAPWLYQIARNVARNRLATRSRWKMEELSTETMTSSGTPPDVGAERSEIRERISAELSRLPDQRRTAFRLVVVEGMEVEEAARIMGLTPGTIRSHVHHARKALRAALPELRDDEPTPTSRPPNG